MTPYLVFWPKDYSQPWHRRFWRGKYGHVSLLIYDNQTWVAVSLEHDGVIVKPFFTSEEVDDYLTYCCHYATVVRVHTEISPRRQFLMPMTCVSFVKHSLGLRSRALFPDGLLASLRASDIAEFINEDPQGTEGVSRAEGRTAPC